MLDITSKNVAKLSYYACIGANRGKHLKAYSDLGLDLTMSNI